MARHCKCIHASLMKCADNFGSLKCAFFFGVVFFLRKLLFTILLSTSKVLLTIKFLSKTYLKRLGQALLGDFTPDQIVIELTKISK